MGRTHLFLVDRRNQPLPKGLRTVVEAAYRWACADFPHLDRAQVATWAEELALAMHEKEQEIQEPRRYAFAALHGKIRQHFRSRVARETLIGESEQLEEWAGVDEESARRMDQNILFQEIGAKLTERDRNILGLLDQGCASPANVAASLGISYNAAAKAIQRAKERTRAMLTGRPLPVDVLEQDENA